MAVPFPAAVERFPKVRQSRLSVFDNCALASKFDIDYREGWSSHPAARGTIVHRTLARCVRIMAERGEQKVPVDVALSELDDVIRQADVGHDHGELSDEVVSIPLREIAEARVTVKTWAMHTAWPVANLAGIEKRLQTTLTYPDGEGSVCERVVTGQLDLLFIFVRGTDFHHAYVVDYKDTWGIPSEKLGVEQGEYDLPSNISEEGYFQQRFYALLVLRNYPRVQAVTLQEFYPRYASGKVLDRQGRAINPKREATVHRAQLGDIEAEMSALLERFDRAHATGKFRPSPGSHCTYCPRPAGCRIPMPSARGVGRITSQAEAERVAGQLVIARAAANQASAALKVWSNAHGPVRIKDAKRPRVYGPVVRNVAGQEKVEFTVHSPDEQHPVVEQARQEEEALAAMERAAEARKAAKR